MATGPCGIDCHACGLNARGICSTCGPGTGPEAARKLEAQQRILGAPCPILACAVSKGLDYCSRDCEDFPCEILSSGPYPFSRAYLEMQERRRRQRPPDKTPSGAAVEVPADFWDELARRHLAVVTQNTGGRPQPPDGLLLPFLDEYLLVDRRSRTVLRQAHANWEAVEDPLLELLCLVYLLRASAAQVRGELVGVRELKNAHFFREPHDLDTTPLLRRYGRDPEAFREAARRLNGTPVDLADTAFCFPAFPKVPLYYLLWEGDEEFPSRLSILFDRSIEEHLAADAIWGLVNLVSGRLLYEK